MTDEQTTEQTLQAALEDFNALNSTLPGGLPPFQLPPTVELSAGMDALVALLIEKGTVGEQEFIDRKRLRMAEIIDHLTEQATEVKRHALGLIVAAPGDMPIQTQGAQGVH